MGIRAGGSAKGTSGGAPLAPADTALLATTRCCSNQIAHLLLLKAIADFEVTSLSVEFRGFASFISSPLSQVQVDLQGWTSLRKAKVATLTWRTQKTQYLSVRPPDHIASPFFIYFLLCFLPYRRPAPTSLSGDRPLATPSNILLSCRWRRLIS